MITAQQRPARPAFLPAGKSIVERMAERILELNRADAGVSKDDLAPFFPRSDIDKHGTEAADLALSRSVRRLD